MITIEKNIPIPRGYTNIAKYPFVDMEIGDSFVCSDHIKSIRACVTNYNQKDRNKKFITRTVGKDTIRVWRVS